MRMWAGGRVTPGQADRTAPLPLHLRPHMGIADTHARLPAAAC